MKRQVKENQVVFAGRVGTVDVKTNDLVSVSIAYQKSKENPENSDWQRVTFTNPKNGEGQKLADLAQKYIEKGQFIVVVCNEVVNGEYTNYYVNAVDLGVRKN